MASAIISVVHVMMADLLTMAVLADGEVTPPKRAALAAALEAGKIDVGPAEAINRLRLRTPELKQPEALREAVAGIGARLSMKDREEALRLAVAIARAGAGLLVEGTYRAGRRSDPRALIELLAAALGVAPAARDAALAGLDAA